MKQLEALSRPDEPAIVLLKAALFVKDRQNVKACQVIEYLVQIFLFLNYIQFKGISHNHRVNNFSPPLQALSDFAAAYPSQNLAASLACAQIHLANKQVDKAAEVLENLGDASYSAGVLGALIALCRSLNDDERAAQIFKRAIGFHKKANPNSELLQSLIRKSAQYFLRLGKQQEAAALLQEQRKGDPHNAKLLAQLVAAYATFDPDKARE